MYWLHYWIGHYLIWRISQVQIFLYPDLLFLKSRDIPVYIYIMVAFRVEDIRVLLCSVYVNGLRLKSVWALINNGPILCATKAVVFSSLVCQNPFIKHFT
ncbi:hypothetical protein BDA96_10G043300 [Sorghum bicolor]|uniref:Uncharacterized protein n=1 Tax=Sorghum bicolor TaxID=4558 RepID=A0A921Q1N2_SORBI|nr:hypothetical protein BDA96_10G043300 [Sorghum bicolor]